MTLDGNQAAQLQRLLDELARWNHAYSLTAVADPASMIPLHLLDSLAVLPAMHGSEILDAGTGAGFPGLPLAVAAPQRQFILLDSVSKKVRFVSHAIRTLRLENAVAVQARAETYVPARPLHTIVARAFAPLPRLLELVQGLCSPGTRVLAMLGEVPAATETIAAAAGFRLIELRTLAVPRLAATRHLAILTPAGDAAAAESIATGQPATLLR